MLASFITSLLCVVVTFSNGAQALNEEPIETTDPTQMFLDLPLEEWEKESIYTIISAMGEKNILQLGFESKSLRKRGKKIDHVHPLRFVGHIFSDPYLKTCMKEVKKSSFKWKGFLRGLSKRMNEEFAKNNLAPHIHGFSAITEVDDGAIEGYINTQDWEGLVAFLVQQKS